MANDMLNNTSSTYLALISIDIASTDNKMNEAAKCFGAVGTITLPLSFITDLWGMKLEVPGDHGPPGEYRFTLVVICFLVWITFGVLVFRRKRWL
jgi:Mg2+ and Co2+ transporter CorA